MPKRRNNIDRIEVSDRSLNAVEAEIWVTVLSEVLTPSTELRGRLVGPSCAFATTVEVAYPIAPLPRPPQGLNGRTARVVIPEPSLWDPESPFLYQGIVEVWEEGKACDRAPIRHGIREFRLTPGGLRVNGRLVPIRGLAREPASDEEVIRLRQAGCNLLLVASTDRALWDRADRFGLLMMLRFDPSEPNRLLPAGEYPQATGAHPSTFARLLPEEFLAGPLDRWGKVPLSGTDSLLVGVELTRPPAHPLPREVQFVVCSADLLPQLTDVHRPKLVLTGSRGTLDAGAESTITTPGVFGWIAP